MDARTILIISAILAAVIHNTNGSSQPNILFIMADDLGYADIGYHGGAGQIKTPHLDKLAYQGVRLENYYVQPVCTPTRSALLSGRLPIYTGLQHLVIFPSAPYGMPLELPTLPQKLKEQGYNTHLVGKWHLGMYKKEYLPVNRGFDSFYGYYQGAEDYFTHSVCNSLNQKTYCGLDLHNQTTPDFNKTGEYSAHLFTQEAIRKINEQSKKKSPMFMYLAYQNVHQPQQAPVEYEKQYEFIENRQRRTLAAQVSILDEAVGNVTAALMSAGMWENTIIIFSSDNGGMTPAGTGVGCNYPLRGSKGTVFEGGMKVPGFVSGPLVSNRGSMSREWIHISDWFPTILRLAGGSVSHLTLDGYDQWGAILGKEKSPRKELIHNIDPLMAWGIRRPGSPFDTRQQAALRIGDYKMVTGPRLLGNWYPPVSLEGEPEAIREMEAIEQEKLDREGLFQNVFLFNITADPFERHDLSRTKPQIVEAMLARLAEYDAKMKPPTYPPGDNKDSDPAKHGGSWEPWE